MTSSISLLTAFLAGLASFLSPCVLPIVPGYLSFISGVNVAQLKGEEAPAHLMRRIGIMSIVFVLGFSTVFVSLGAAATMLGYYLGSILLLGNTPGVCLWAAPASRRPAKTSFVTTFRPRMAKAAITWFAGLTRSVAVSATPIDASPDPRRPRSRSPA